MDGYPAQISAYFERSKGLGAARLMPARMGKMKYDFDYSIDRKYSDSLKWRDARANDVIPMWVAGKDSCD